MPFILSDSPVIQTNYFAKIKKQMRIPNGFYSSGAQIFQPISPWFAVYYHDRAVYGVDHYDDYIDLKDTNDVLNFNKAQIVNSGGRVFIPPSRFTQDIVDSVIYKGLPERLRFQRMEAVDDNSYRLSNKSEYDAPDVGKEILLTEKIDTVQGIKFKALKIRDKPNAFIDGSALGPIRNPVWYQIVDEASKAVMKGKLHTNNLCNFIVNHPMAPYVDPNMLKRLAGYDEIIQHSKS